MSGLLAHAQKGRAEVSRDRRTRSRPRATRVTGEPSLSELAIFASVRPRLYDRAERREYRDGELILEKGAQPDRLIVLVRGDAEVRQGTLHIASRPAIRLLGELASIDGKPRSASVFAHGPAVTYELAHEDAMLLFHNRQFLRNLACELSWKLRSATDDRAWRYRDEELLFGAYREHAAPELLNELLQSGDLGEPRRTDAITLFVDIRDFTAKTVTVPPEHLSRDLAAFFEAVVPAIHSYGGMVDKLIGDAVMAVWGYAPKPGDPERAIAAAVEVVRRCSCLMFDGAPMRVGIGIESGPVTLGVIGALGKRQFTALGPSVNLAARLQEETKALSAPICVGPDLANRLPAAWRNRLGEPIQRDIRGVGATRVWPLTPKE